MPTYLQTKPKNGDKVSVDHPQWPGIYTVTSTKGTRNAKLSRDSDGFILNAPYGLLIEPQQAAPGTEQTVFHPGEFVRIERGAHAGVWVVIADRGADKVNLARLGGDGGKYLRATKRGIVRVPAVEVMR